jgi:nucleoside-diphosphate-sugar epimerase
VRAIVVGCGYVGSRVGELLHVNGCDVIGVQRSPADQTQFRFVSCDITEPDKLREHPECVAADFLVYCVSSGRGGAAEYQRVYVEGLRNVIDVWRPRRFVFTSSTSVYAQTDGSCVTEESPAEPQHASGKILRAAESIALSKGGIVARLAGIYGPGRSVLIRRFIDGTAVIEEDGTRYINQVHREDAAAALCLLSSAEIAGSIFNVCDDRPVTQLQYYQILAEHFGRPLPPYGPRQLNRKRGWTNKRVSNAKLRSLGWQCIYPSIADALKNDQELLRSFL